MNSSTKPLQVNGFDHITLIVADLEATRDFYVGLLGMEEKPRPAFDFPGAWFEIGSVQIHATVASELAGLSGWGERKVRSISRGHHFAFEINSVVEAYQEIQRLNIKVGVNPKFRPDGIHQLYIYDPDGHLVELFSKPEKLTSKDH